MKKHKASGSVAHASRLSSAVLLGAADDQVVIGELRCGADPDGVGVDSWQGRGQAGVADDDRDECGVKAHACSRASEAMGTETGRAGAWCGRALRSLTLGVAGAVAVGL
ncbi:hypothetical protein [Streptomyces chartreusis]|uniref:hypothetical protein n=1 Tax=Streptomyces chartreusis TaxID=1969 RepID=UPI003D72A618